MIEKDKKYEYKELMDIVAKASAKAAESDSFEKTIIKAMMYAELMNVLFDDEEINKEFFKEQKDKEN